MNVDKLREQLKIDEGCVYEIYLDHLGYPTFGIGHLVIESDPENGQAVGTPVSDDAHGKRMVLGHIIVFLWHFSRYSWGSVVDRGSLKLCNTGIMNPGTEVTYVTLQVS